MLEDYQLVYIVLELVIALLAVAGNTLVCWSVFINSNLQSITNFFVVSLAVADIAVGLLAIPFAITISFGFCTNFYGCLFIACFVLVLTQSSIFSLLAIAVDRYIAIKNPLRYTSVVTGQRAKSFIALCWVLSVGIGLTPMMGWYSDEGSNSTNPVNSMERSCPEGLTKCLFEGVVTMNYMIYFNFFGCVLLPLMVMLAIYIHIFFAARRQLRLMSLKVFHIPVQKVKTPPLSASRSTLQKEVHAAKSLAIIVGLFAVCWLPLHIINCVNHLCHDCERTDIWVMNIAIILSHANSVVNPLIYAYRIREFRLTFRKILYQRVLGKRNGRRRGSCSIDGTVAGSNSIFWTSSRVSREASSCETVVNNFVPDLIASKGSRELDFQWTSNLDAAPSSHILNGLQIKTKARSSQCAAESDQHVGEAAQVLDLKQQGSSLAFVNIPALSLHSTGFGQSTTLTEIS